MVSRKGFTPVVLIAVLALVIAVGGVGIGLAWKTDYLDKWLPANIKEMFGRGEKPEEEPEEEPAEESEEAPEEKPKPKPKLPVISGVKISNVTETSFTVTWKTDVPTTSRVEFGKTTSYGGYWFSTRSRTQHSLTPKGLTRCTTYHYRVISKDAKGNKAISSDSTFTTACLAEDPLKSWKTYRSTEYRFEIKYPGSWVFKGAVEFAPNAGDFGSSWDRSPITIYAVPPGVYDTWPGPMGAPGHNLIRTTKIAVAGCTIDKEFREIDYGEGYGGIKKGLFAELTSPCGVDLPKTKGPNGGPVTAERFVLFYAYDLDTNPYESIYDSMLSTFKFIE